MAVALAFVVKKSGFNVLLLLLLYVVAEHVLVIKVGIVLVRVGTLVIGGCVVVVDDIGVVVIVNCVGLYRKSISNDFSGYIS